MPHGSQRGSPSKTWALPTPTSTTLGHTASAACSVRLPARAALGQAAHEPARRVLPLPTAGSASGSASAPCSQPGGSATHRHRQLSFRRAQRLVDRAVDDFIRNNLDLAGDEADFHLVLIALQAQAVRLFLTTKIEPACQSLEQHSELQWIFLFTFRTPCGASHLGPLPHQGHFSSAPQETQHRAIPHFPVSHSSLSMGQGTSKPLV